jgi:DNA-binding beta-propeller fold protein YncE
VIDPERGALVAAVPVGTRPTRLTATSDAVWVATAGDATVSRIDAEQARVTRTIPTGADTVAAGAGAVWALDRKGRLVRIDPRDRVWVSVH